MKFGRKELENAVNKYKRITNRNFVLASKLSSKQLSNAAKHSGRRITEKDIVAFLDTTLFSSGKEGIILTENDILFTEHRNDGVDIRIATKAEVNGMELKTYFPSGGFRRVKLGIYASETASLINAIAKERLLAEMADLKAEEEAYQAEIKKEKAAPQPVPEVKPVVKKEETDEELMARAGSLYGEQKYSEALAIYKILAEKGIAKAQNNCAEMNYFGRGTEKNIEEAAFWFRKAAENGSASSAYNLGVLYNIGEIGLEDKKTALHWFEVAAERGYDLAQFVAGKAYVYGNGTEQNYDKAVFWLEKAAEQGHEKAAELLKQLKAAYEEEKAKAERAKAEKAKKEAEYDICPMDGEKLFYYGNRLYNEGRKTEAYNCYLKSAAEGYSSAMCAAAEMIFCGETGKGNEEDAVKLLDKAKAGKERMADILEDKYKNAIAEVRRKWEIRSVYEDAKFELEHERFYTARDKFKKAAEAGHIEAMYEYGAIMESGRGGRRDIDEAIFWLEKAKENGISKGDDMLSLLRYEKESLKSHDEKPERKTKPAETYPELVKKALAGDTAAMRKCANRCENGREGTKTEALFWFLEAARAGDDIGMANLGRLFQFGIGTPVNNIKALEWYEKSYAAKWDYEALKERLIKGEVDDIPDMEAMAEFIEDCSAEGEMYYEVGFGFEDWFRGYMYLSIAAEFDEPLAQYYLGEMFCEDGEYHNKDLEKAKYWFERAEENGNEDAPGMLGNIFIGVYDRAGV